MKLLFDWLKNGFRTATREGIQLGVSDAMTAITGGQVEYNEPARIEAQESEPQDDTPPESTAVEPPAAANGQTATRQKPKTAARKPRPR